MSRLRRLRERARRTRDRFQNMSIPDTSHDISKAERVSILYSSSTQTVGGRKSDRPGALSGGQSAGVSAGQKTRTDRSSVRATACHAYASRPSARPPRREAATRALALRTHSPLALFKFSSNPRLPPCQSKFCNVLLMFHIPQSLPELLCLIICQRE